MVIYGGVVLVLLQPLGLMQYLESDETVSDLTIRNIRTFTHTYTCSCLAIVPSLLDVVFCICGCGQVPENEVDRMHIRDNLKVVTVSEVRWLLFSTLSVPPKYPLQSLV